MLYSLSLNKRSTTYCIILSTGYKLSEQQSASAATTNTSSATTAASTTTTSAAATTNSDSIGRMAACEERHLGLHYFDARSRSD